MFSNFPRMRFVSSCLVMMVVGLCFAQEGVSTASAARTRSLSNAGVLPKPQDVVVEDFINYHRHEIGRPKAGEAVGLDVRWGNDSIRPRGEGILQIGMSTALLHDRSQIRPLNLSVVIDKSGSMADDDKLVHVKQALSTMVDGLRPSDVLSIIVFDSEAEVLLPAQPISDRSAIKSAIQSIEPGSATNLCGGLVLGYKEALRHYQKDATNRVILLTDGIANRGVTDPTQIAKASEGYNDRGIDLTTIGVGQDLNKDLLQTLAKSGHGLFHFIADSQDIQKVFVKELQSQISPVAEEPRIVIEYGPALTLEKLYGYRALAINRRMTIRLDNMNNGMTQVILLKFKSQSDDVDVPQTVVRVKLSYYDIDRKQTVETSQEAPIEIAAHPRKNPIEDASVGKNYVIACLAQGIHDMAAEAENNYYREAEKTLVDVIRYANSQYPNLDDEDIKRVMVIAEKYQTVLRDHNRDQD